MLDGACLPLARWTFSILLGAFASMFLTACEPRDVYPGLWLSGEEVTENIDDWRFADQVEEIFIETQAWYGLPHSKTIWCVELRGTLFIGSYGAEKKNWENNLLRQPKARLKINNGLYDVVVTEVSDKVLTAALDQAYNGKYDMADVFGKEIPTWWYYKVEQIRR